MSVLIPLEEFLKLAASGKLVPVFDELLADIETPLSAYWKLAQGGIHSFLLESVTGGEQLARYSILGVRPKNVIEVTRDAVVIKNPTGNHEVFTLKEGEDALNILEQHLPGEVLEIEGMPKFIGGAVGALSYDFVRSVENLPDGTRDDFNAPELAMMITDVVVVFDHAKNIIRTIVLAEPTEDGYRDAVEKIAWVRNRLREPLTDLPTGSYPPREIVSNMSQSQFESAVLKVKDYIGEGDGVQMVLSQRFETDSDAHPVTVYRALRRLNPSPYMFIFRFEEFSIVGSSPELLVGLAGDTARVRPVAGTRWRGKSIAEDNALADELIRDEKEIAEHVMLVDLGRNDLGRVCEYGTVTVGELMVVERYSHVMHIVSDVTGKLDPAKSGFDLIRATFPAGTVSGAPKVRAMQIIDELEPTRRGFYAGAIGYFSANKDIDLAITLRTIFLKDGKAYVQAGAGIVFDSVPTSEYNETRNKAGACLAALELAQKGID